jgi:hypothetical protein
MVTRSQVEKLSAGIEALVSANDIMVGGAARTRARPAGDDEYEWDRGSALGLIEMAP